jgi:hypothetical protein
VGYIPYTFIMITAQEPDEQETGICNSCGGELEPIMENNGFTEPAGPSKWEVSGYEPCADCNQPDDNGDEE